MKYLSFIFSQKTLLATILMITFTFTINAKAQQRTQQFQCTGYINGVPSQALLEIAPGGMYTEGPGVAGRIKNKYSDYTFTGTMFGGNKGFVSLVELRTGERIDRVWIGLGQGGFTLRTEDGSTYSFRC